MDSRDVLTKQTVGAGTKALAKSLRKTSTPAEEAFWNMVRGKRLAGLKFRRQQVIDGYIADFYCSTGNFVVEIDGSIHDDLSKEHDKQRDRYLQSKGIRVLRLMNEEVSGMPSVARSKVLAFSSNAPANKEAFPRK